MNSTAIIFCVESGYLENMSKLLVTSLRKFSGRWKDVPVYAYQPRKGKSVSLKTKKFFESNHVTFIDENLNKTYRFYPPGNKVYACEHAANNLDYDNLMFVDTDTYFYNEPAEFSLMEDNQVALRPVYKKYLGAGNEHDPNWQYWKELYELIGVKELRYVKTSVDGDRILEYYNAGHILAQSSSGLFSIWKKNFELVMRKGIKPIKYGLYFTDQTTLAATISSMQLKVRQFSEVYNYPLMFNDELGNTDRNLELSQLVTVHYQDYFKKHRKSQSWFNHHDMDDKLKELKNLVFRFKLHQRDSMIQKTVNRIDKLQNLFLYKKQSWR